MHVRDAAGRRVSLLNDEPPAPTPYSRPSLVPKNSSFSSTYSGSSAWSSDDARTRRSISVTSSISNPSTPDLGCTDYEPQIAEPSSPGTPVSMDYEKNAYHPGNSYHDHAAEGLALYHEYADERQQLSKSHHKKTHADENSTVRPTAARTASDKSTTGKRYPCRYKVSHGCDKTFTTSGHASRHSKIHTAEKAVNCSYPGCIKKFTRADNMKQHLETHFKERFRSTKANGVKRPSLSATHSKSSRSRLDDSVGHSYSFESQPSTSSTIYESMDMGDFRNALLSRPVAARTDSSGLDALAQLASACQARC